jgi:beta-galactosidase
MRLIIMTGVMLSLAPLMQPGVRANDSMFAPQPAAQAMVNFDRKGFLINGQRIFVVSAGMEYARVPQALWADRLTRFKRAGFNCTEFYTFWNYHEPQSGQFDFSTNCDLNSYLELAKSLGLYAIARVGPYYCAEWDSGGYPIWLRNAPNLQVRTANAAFEQYVTRYWGQLLPIVVTNQIDRGGNVILVQLENEHPSGWGTDGLSDPYFQYLQSTALGAGLEVPYFFSGLNHGSDPAGSAPWSSSTRTSPWFTTEFWCNWYSEYGETSSDVSGKDWSTWKILAYGGNGYNYYMAHGGTDFNYFNDDEVAASYDYGAAVGQTGDLRPEYYKFKRAAWFARSFQNILETSDNASSAYANAAANSAIAVTARQGAAGTILFLGNSGTSAQQTTVNISGVAYPQTGSLTVNPSEIMPVVIQCAIIPGVTLSVAPTRILGITQQANTTTIVIYGQAGLPAELYFNVPTGTTISAGAPALGLSGTNLTLQTSYPASGASDFSFQTGSQRVRILAVSDTLADDTWFVDVGTQTYVVCGPQYVGDATVTNSYLQLTTEIPWQNAANNPVTAYGPGDTPMSLSAITTPGAHPGAATLSAWQTLSGTNQAAPGYDTSAWLSSSSGPQQMGADGDVSCYAWYRTAVNAPTDGTYAISLGSVADAMIPFVDGTAVPAANISANSFTAGLSAGNHTVAIFTSHNGRNKLYGYVGPISQEYVKGLSGTAYLFGGLVGGPASLTSWQVMMTNSAAVRSSPPATNASGWTSYTVGSDAFGGQPGYAWFQTVLPSVPSAGAEIASFSSVDDNGWVYLNGTLLATNYGWNVPFAADLTRAWNASGPNVLTVLIQNTGGIGGLDSGVTFSAYQSESALNSWVQQGGPGNPDASTGWQTLIGGETFSGPQFFKSTFTASPFGTIGTDPMWRVTTSGLSSGSVLVNGHNLGRYPEKIAAPGVYIPECWLNAGANANTLVIYDESGNLPTQVQVQPEAAASRDVVNFQSAQTVTMSAPPAPIGLAAVASGAQVTLAWNASANATSYNVKRSAISNGPYAVVAMGVIATNYTDTGLAAATTYYYVVSAVNSENESTNSVQVSATTAVAGPVGLTATEVSSSQVNLTWNALTNAASYNVKRSTTSGGPYAVIATGLTTTNYSNTGLIIGDQYYYVVSAVVGGVESYNSAEASALPYPWLTQDVGAVGVTGSATYSNGVFTVTGSGDDIWNTADAFRFVYMTVTGNCTNIARVTAVQDIDPWSKAGVMIRESLASNAVNAFIAVTPGNGVTWQTRSSTGGATSNSAAGSLSAPYWVKLVRSGSTFTGYRSPDGVTWTPQGTATITMASTAYIGLALTSHNNSSLCAATFDNVTAPGWTTSAPPASPASLSASAGDAQAVLIWPASIGAISYNVKRATLNGGPYTIVTNVTTTNCTDSGLSNGVNYYYVVSALNTAGESANSAQVSATPVKPPQPRIVGISIAGGSLMFSGTNGLAGGAYAIWSSTNLATPLSNWTQAGSGYFDGNGNFSITNVINTNKTQQFFMLRQP